MFLQAVRQGHRHPAPMPLPASVSNRGDCITIAMPTAPQGIICFYAANKLGIVASMIHPLSTAKEIIFYATISKSRCALTMEEHYDKFKEIIGETPLEILILTNHDDGFPDRVTGGKPEHADPMVNRWQNLMTASLPEAPLSAMKTDDMAVILYSGGTTGVPKGIMLSNFNFITQGLMSSELRKKPHGDVPMAMIASMPIFHGYGLGIGCNAMFMSGGKSILVSPSSHPISLPSLSRKNARQPYPGFPLSTMA